MTHAWRDEKASRRIDMAGCTSNVLYTFPPREHSAVIYLTSVDDHHQTVMTSDTVLIEVGMANETDSSTQCIMSQQVSFNADEAELWIFVIVSTDADRDGTETCISMIGAGQDFA